MARVRWAAADLSDAQQQQKDLACLVPLPDGSLMLRLRVQPRAAHNQVAGLQGDALKIRLTTPPVDGKANAAVIAFLARLFDLPKAAFRLTSGQQSRNKTVVITGALELHLRLTLNSILAVQNS